MVIQVTNYVFAPGGAGVGTITFSGYVSIELKNIILITNVTDGEIIYNFRIPGNTGTVATNVLTLMESTAAMSAGDELQIIYNDPTLSANTSNLATQATLASILAAIAGTLTVSGTVTANAGTNLNTSALALEATLQSVKTAVEVIDNFISGARGLVTEDNSAAIKTALELIDNAISGTEMQVDVITQPALSQNTDSVTIYGSDDGGATKRVIKTDAAGEIQVDISSSSLALEATLQSVKTAVEIIDNFISGARGLVTEDNSAAILAALAGTLTIAGTVTANAGTNLNTSALALEATLQSVKTAVEILDNAIAGSEMQVDVVAPLPAGTNNIGDVDVLSQPARVATTDSISSKDSTDVIQNGLVALTPKFAIIDAATSGDNTLLAAVASKKIRVVSLYLVASAAVTVRFESGAGGTALSGQMNLAANGGFVLPYNPVGWFETASNTLLNLELSGAISVDGGFTYIEV